MKELSYCNQQSKSEDTLHMLCRKIKENTRVVVSRRFRSARVAALRSGPVVDLLTPAIGGHEDETHVGSCALLPVRGHLEHHLEPVLAHAGASCRDPHARALYHMLAYELQTLDARDARQRDACLTRAIKTHGMFA